MSSYHGAVRCFYLLLVVGVSWGTLSDDAFGQAEDNRIKMGGFLVRPSLAVEQSYTSNLLFTQTDRQADFVTKVTPDVRVEKNIRDHEFSFAGSASSYRHARKKSEDRSDARADFQGRVVVLHKLKVPFGLSYERSHVDRSDDRSIVMARTPLRTGRFAAFAGVVFKPNRMGVDFTVTQERKTFADGLDGTGVSVIRHDGDYRENSGRLRLGYDMRAGWTPFVQADLHDRGYQRGSYNGTDFSGDDRDFRNSLYSGGVAFDRGMYSGSLAVGLQDLGYDKDSLPDQEILALQAALAWSVTPATTIDIHLSRMLEDDFILRSPFVSSRLSLEGVRELNQRVSARVGFEGRYEDFNTTVRDDRVYSAVAGVDYEINSKLRATGNVSHHIRNSNVSGADDRESRMTVGLTGSL